MATAAGGTHPTAMHSCCKLKSFILFCQVIPDQLCLKLLRNICFLLLYGEETLNVHLSIEVTIIFSIIEKSFFKDCNNEMDLVFLFDSSISVGEEKFRKQLEFAKGVIEPLEFASGRTQVAAITYSNEAYVQWQVMC